MELIVIPLLIIFVIVATFLGIFIPLAVINNKYTKFVLEHSSAIKNLKEINNRYQFADFRNQIISHSYDNENFYADIAPADYLIYQLVCIQKDVLKRLNAADDNKDKYARYTNEIAEKCELNSFDTDQLLKNLKRLQKTEKKVFRRTMKAPCTEYEITVRLTLTDIAGNYRRSKEKTYGSKAIRSLIGRVNNKVGTFYQDREIWEAIVRVERGRVSNKLRFRVYARDGNRCVKCGRRTDLEVDHIIPIAKGGKTTLNNLQTLCHRCNVKKGSSIEYY